MPIESRKNEPHASKKHKHTYSIGRSSGDNGFQVRESNSTNGIEAASPSPFPSLSDVVHPSFLQYSHVNSNLDRSCREHNTLFPSLSIHPSLGDALCIGESEHINGAAQAQTKSNGLPLQDENNSRQSVILDSRVFEWLPRGQVPQLRTTSSSASLLPPPAPTSLDGAESQSTSTALVLSRKVSPLADLNAPHSDEKSSWSLIGSSSHSPVEYDTLDSQTAFGALQHNTIDENSSFDVFFSLPTLAPPMPDETIAAQWPSFSKSSNEEKEAPPSEMTSQLVRYDERQSLLTRVLKNSIDHESSNKRTVKLLPEPPETFNEVSDSTTLISRDLFNPLGLGVPSAPFDDSAAAATTIDTSSTYEVPSWITPVDVAFLNNDDAKRRRLDQETKAQQQQQERVNHLWQLLHQQETGHTSAASSHSPHKLPALMQPSSTAFPHHTLPHLTSTPTFTQATWESHAAHRNRSQVSDCSFVPNSIHSLALFEMMLMRVMRADEIKRHYVADEQLLVSQLLLMLHGISTPYFRWNPEDRTFELFPAECRLKDSSPAALRRVLAPLLRLGSQIKCLFEFASLQSVTGVGVVLHAFATGVDQFLQQYSLAIIQLHQTILKRRQDEKGSIGSSAPVTLLELSVHLQAAQSKMQYLTDLCGLPASLDTLDEFPRGAVLLSHLFTMCLSHECSLLTTNSNSLMLRSLFIRCLQAYMRIVEAWMFRGELQDPFQEFIVEWREVTTTRRQLGGDLFATTDSHNGRQIRLAHRRLDAQLPVFFQHLEACIFHAGQTVHLLQLYQPRVLRSVSAAQLLQQQLAMDMKRRQQRTSSLELQADEAIKKRTERLKQQEDYARELRQQLSEKEAALAELAQRAASESAAEAAVSDQKAAIIAAERARLLAQIEAVRSPYSISGGLNPSLDWRTAREQLSPLRVKKLLQLEQEQVEQLEQIVMPSLESEQQEDFEEVKQQISGLEQKSQVTDAITSVPTIDSTKSDSTVDDKQRQDKSDVAKHLNEEALNSNAINEIALTLPSTSTPTIQETSSSAPNPSVSVQSVIARDAESDLTRNTIVNSSTSHSSSSPLQLRSLHFLSRELSEQVSADSDELNEGEQFSTSHTEHALTSLSRQYQSPTSSPLPILLQSRLFPALLSHASHVATLGVAHFERVHMCSTHFEVLRDYLLMQNGSVMGTFCEDLWQWSRQRMNTVGRVNLSDSMLKSMLETACKLRHSNYNSIQHQLALNHVSFRVDPSVHISLTDLKSWRAIALHYVTPYPLSLVIPKHTIQLYSRVFQFLLQLHHVEAELHEMWNLLRQSSTMASTTRDWSAERRHRMRVLECSRSEMAHFVHVLRGYCMTEVIESSWSVLKKKCEIAKSWMEMRDLHQDHISYVARACFRVSESSDRKSRQQHESDESDENQLDEAGDDDDGMNHHFSSPAFTRVRPSASIAAANHSVAVISSAIDKILDAILDYKTRLSAVSLGEFIPKQDWLSLISSRDRFRNYVQFLVTLLQHHAHPLLPMQNLGTQQLTANDLLRRLDFNGFYQTINANQSIKK